MIERALEPTVALQHLIARNGFAVVPSVVNGLGVVLGRMDNHGAAVAMYGEALRLRPSFAEARYNLALSLARLGRYADAIESCRAALVRRPDLEQARTLLFSLQTALGSPLRCCRCRRKRSGCRARGVIEGRCEGTVARRSPRRT